MTQIPIEIHEPIVAMLDGVVHSGADCRSESKLPGPFDQFDTGIGLLVQSNPIGRAIGRVVIDDEDIGIGRRGSNRLEEVREVFPFVGGTDQYQARGC